MSSGYDLNKALLEDKKPSKEAEDRKAKRELRSKKQALRNDPERKKKRHRKFVFAVALFFLFLLACMLVIKNILPIMKLSQELEEKQLKLDETNHKTELLQEELEEINDPEYIEDSARINLHMIKDGEIQFIIKGKGDD